MDLVALGADVYNDRKFIQNSMSSDPKTKQLGVEQIVCKAKLDNSLVMINLYYMIYMTIALIVFIYVDVSLVRQITAIAWVVVSLWVFHKNYTQFGYKLYKINKMKLGDKCP